LPFPVQGLGKGTVSLDGPWQFHVGDDPGWALPGCKDTTGQNGWEQLSALEPWGAQGHPSYNGFGWYRIHLKVTPSPGAPDELHLLMPKVDDVYEVYWNGALVGKFGKMPPAPVMYYLQPPATFGLGKMRDGLLAVRVWKAPPLSDGTAQQGGFESPPVLGGPEAIGQLKASLDYDWIRSNQFNFGLNSLYGLAAFLALLTWLSNRRQRMMLWMTGFCLSQPLMLFALFMRLPTPRPIALPFYQFAASMEDVSLWFLLLLLFRLDELPGWTKWVGRLAIVQMILVNLDGVVCSLELTLRLKNVALAQSMDYGLTMGYTLLEALPLVLVIRAIVRRRELDAGRWTVAAFAFLTEMIAVTSTAAEQGRVYTHWTLADTLEAPLFTLRGNEINPQTLAGTLLLFSLLYAVQRYSADERNRQAALEQEFQNARELQKVLIPETLPEVEGFQFTTSYCPAQEVGGDFFQIIPLSQNAGSATAGSTLIVLGDVSGKGVKAAMAVALIVGTIRAFAETTNSPGEILTGLNRRLYGRMQGGFATCIAICLEPNGFCTLASAGQTAPFLNDREVDLPGAIPLGIMPTLTYEEGTLQLNPNDHLALYTDGLLEARSATGELYSFERLQLLFATRPTAEQATEAAIAFGQDDDITVLMLSRSVLAAD
jgi:hypothetical protein